LLQEVTSQRAKVFGLFLAAPYITRLTRLRTEMFNNVHILTLAYVVRLPAAGNSTLAKSARLFDCTKFLSASDAQEFWLTHAGATVCHAWSASATACTTG
jgi:hypothetical protein